MMETPEEEDWDTADGNVAVEGSPVHGLGVFAGRDFEEGESIIEYFGEKISNEEGQRRGLELMEEAELTGGAAVYIFTLDDKYDLDGDVPGNTAKLINHSCDPNCEAQQEGDRIWIVALREINEGDELGFNYGFDLECFEDHPCRCGSERCAGFIVAEEYWPELVERLEALLLAEDEEE